MHVVRASLFDARTRLRMPELGVDVVAPNIAADRRVESHAAEIAREPIRERGTVERASIDLFDFVAAIGVVQIEGAVGI